MGFLVPIVFNLLYRFYVPIWRRYPSVILGTKLHERRNMRTWVPIALAAIPTYLGLMYAAGAVYHSTGWMGAAICSCIWGIAYFKLLLGVPILLARHGILTMKERRAQRRTPVAAMAT